ncbi:hypothetical protein LTR08_004568 [Meristemomyces frigidus]|nr:hypothetical protein LTR08_004568 [Meristemomyces frigidus]
MIPSYRVSWTRQTPPRPLDACLRQPLCRQCEYTRAFTLYTTTVADLTAEQVHHRTRQRRLVLSQTPPSLEISAKLNCAKQFMWEMLASIDQTAPGNDMAANSTLRDTMAEAAPIFPRKCYAFAACHHTYLSPAAHAEFAPARTDLVV